MNSIIDLKERIEHGRELEDEQREFLLALLDKVEIVDTVDALIDSLGGTGATARLIGRRPAAVSQWRRKGIPPELYFLLLYACAARLRWAPTHVFQFEGTIRPEVLLHPTRQRKEHT